MGVHERLRRMIQAQSSFVVTAETKLLQITQESSYDSPADLVRAWLVSL